MGSMFGGGGGSRSHFGSREQRGVRERDQLLNDLLGNALVGSLYPQPMGIPSPLAKGIGGLESMLPSLFGQAFGPTRGLAGMLSGRPMDPEALADFLPSTSSSYGGSPATGPLSSSSSPGDLRGLLDLFPMFGDTPSRADLGLSDPSLAPPGFLPPADVAARNLGGVRTAVPDRFKKIDRRLGSMRERQDELESAGRMGRANRLGRKIARKEDKRERMAARRGYVSGTPPEYSR